MLFWIPAGFFKFFAIFEYFLTDAL